MDARLIRGIELYGPGRGNGGLTKRSVAARAGDFAGLAASDGAAATIYETGRRLHLLVVSALRERRMKLGSFVDDWREVNGCVRIRLRDVTVWYTVGCIGCGFSFKVTLY